MKHLRGLFAFVLVCLAGGMSAAERSADIEMVLRTDAQRLEAMMAGRGLERIFADELVLVHSDGRVEGKKEYIANLTAGDTAYANVKTSDVQAHHASPDVIVLIGAQEMRKKLGPTWSDIKLRFLSVWKKQNGTWRIVAWQSARPAGNSTVPPK